MPENICACGKPGDIKQNNNIWLCNDCHTKAGFKEVQKDINMLLKEKGIGKRYISSSFNSFFVQNDSQNKAVNILKGINYQFSDFVFITSQSPGTGKTHLAVSVFRELIINGIQNIFFISSPFIFLEIKNSFNSETDNEKSIINKFCNYDFLVIDDIGIEKVSDWAIQIWYMIIDRRYSELKPTIFTSNLTIGDIAENLDMRIASRLSSGIVLTIDGDDYRLKNRRS